MKTATLRHIARRILIARYGFAPSLGEIVLLESDDFGHYIMIDVNGHQYQLFRDDDKIDVIEYGSR